MRRYRSLLPFVAVAVLAPPVGAQTMGLDYTAGAAQTTGSSADYAVNLFASSAQSSLNLTPGITVPGVDLGTLSFSSTGRGPNNVIETIPFSFTRPLSLILNGDLVAASPETLSGTWSAEHAGSVGQYFVTNFTLNGNTALYDFGAFGTVEAAFQPGQAFNDGLGGPTTIPITADLTYHVPTAVPEPAPLVLLVMCIPLLGGAALRVHKRQQNAE